MYPLLVHVGQRVDENGIRVFLSRSQDICEFWTSLLHNTSLPAGITHQDVQVTNVFKYVEYMITSSTMERQLVRLVWIRLPNILDRFDEVIKSDRRTRRLDENQGKRNASITIKIHQESMSAAQRSEIKWSRRIARRWTLLTNGSLLLAIAFPNRADTLV
ncbi:hypothetical protein EDB80DRAFT_595620 [Ilyonectria destructans]|nr:hypothetical protein EDB80DRAFT_595620 [Ilyonectria destructans]